MNHHGHLVCEMTVTHMNMYRFSVRHDCHKYEYIYVTHTNHDETHMFIAHIFKESCHTMNHNES